LILAIVPAISVLAQNAKPVFDFKVAGGFPDSIRLTIDVFPDGLLRAETSSFGKTISKIEKRISQAEVNQILLLASEASNAKPTPSVDVVDSRWAGFAFTVNGKRVTCPSGPAPGQWANQLPVKRLISGIDKYLAGEMKIDFVIHT
jgi:hypothetical protein